VSASVTATTMAIPPAPVAIAILLIAFHPITISVAVIVLSRCAGKRQTADTED
jgi:hypothetical protein